MYLCFTMFKLLLGFHSYTSRGPLNHNFLLDFVNRKKKRIILKSIYLKCSTPLHTDRPTVNKHLLQTVSFISLLFFHTPDNIKSNTELCSSPHTERSERNTPQSASTSSHSQKDSVSTLCWKYWKENYNNPK